MSIQSAILRMIGQACHVCWTKQPWSQRAGGQASDGAVACFLAADRLDAGR
jgi:hypothetical protein